MKTTGMVRRIDELGRVVIPKEIRRTMKIKEGEEVEVFVAPQNTVVLKKYSAVNQLNDLIKSYAETVYQITQNNCFITDTEEIVACGNENSVYLKSTISDELAEIIKSRKSIMLIGDKIISVTASDKKKYKEMFVSPILCNGDVYGAVVLACDKKNMGEHGLDLVKVTSGFLSRQIY